MISSKNEDQIRAIVCVTSGSRQAPQYKVFRSFWHCALTVLPLPQQLEAPVRNGNFGSPLNEGVTSSQSLFPETLNQVGHGSFWRCCASRRSFRQSVPMLLSNVKRAASGSLGLRYQAVCRSRHARMGGKPRTKKGAVTGRARRPSSNFVCKRAHRSSEMTPWIE